MVMNTKTYDPSEFPAFAVTVDVVVLTMANGQLHVLLVQRGVDPFEGMWAIPGGFKRPDETLDEAAQRELNEETSIDGETLLWQFRAYGDPGRDPRMNIVTVAYVAVIQNIGTPAASTDAAAAALIPVEDALSKRVSLAFDHATILRDAVERVRTDLELTGTATAFLPPTFTLAELRSVYEAVWDIQLDAANFRKRVLAEDGWVLPTGRRARPGAAGGKPAELYRAGRRWKHGSPVRRRRARP
jgi:8-oxo-dGTP diphosphatase